MLHHMPPPFQDAKWYVYLEFGNLDGRTAQVPDVDLCLRCGLGLVAYPGLTKEAAAAKYGESKKWQLEFVELVRRSASKVAQAPPVNPSTLAMKFSSKRMPSLLW